jgi:hypothetical protein
MDFRFGGSDEINLSVFICVHLWAISPSSLTPMSQMTADSAGGMAIFTAKTPRKDQDTKELRGF